MGDPLISAQHARQVMRLLDEYPRLPAGIDKPVAYSWLRCAREHQLHPDSPEQTVVLERYQLRERQQRLEDLLMIAGPEMDSLYEQIAGSGYALMLTDATGVILSEKLDPNLRNLFCHAGLLTGADWSERHEGTNGIGTCITERRAITIHLNDHFNTRHIGLSCSAAPIRDPGGELIAVLDASCLGAEDGKASRAHTIALLNLSARMIEKYLFLRRHRSQRIIRFHSRPEFVNLLHDGALALESDGRIVAADEMAVALLSAECRGDLVGRWIEEIFDLQESALAACNGSASGESIQAARDTARGRRYYLSLRGPQNGRSSSVAVPHPAAVSETRASAPVDARVAQPTPDAASTAETTNPLLAAEREALLRTLSARQWNMSVSARQLGISRNTLYRKLKQHGLSPSTLRNEAQARPS